MRQRWLVGTGLLLALLGCAVFGNVSPTMEDQYVVTVQDAAVTFTVSASDEDIDLPRVLGPLLELVECLTLSAHLRPKGLELGGGQESRVARGSGVAH